MILPRVYDQIEKLLKSNKVTVLYGPRRVGKTTTLKRFIKETKLNYRFDTGDDVRVQEVLSSQRLDKLKEYVGNTEVVVIDEAQLIPNIGLNLKLMVDHIPNIKIIATGSASFDLANKIGEPLVGRQWTYLLYPVSQFELKNDHNVFDLQSDKEKYLIYGSYPEVLTSKTLTKKQLILQEITGSYLLKDILALERIKSPKILTDLLKLLAFQMGSEVSLNELGTQLGIDKKTVARYLDLLEKSFIIFNLRGYSFNLRKAISKKSKYYFWDNGIRNAIINNFNPLDTRNDVGALWENFLAIERRKKQAYKPIYSSNYFWRTWDGKEVDWVEMRNGKLFGYEFKWGKGGLKHKKAWLESYPKQAVFKLINKDNYLKFIS